MKVCVSVHGRFHAFELAAGLQRRGRLASLLTTYPGFAVDRLAGTDMPVRAAWWLEARRRVPGLAITDGELAAAFGRFAATHLPDGADLLVGWSASTLEAMTPAKAKGMKVVIERGSSHIEHQTQVLRDAYAAFGLPFEDTQPEVIERELAEYQNADAIAVPSAFAARTFVERGVPEESLLVNPYGVNLAQFAPLRREERGARVRIVFVGRVGIRKGVPGLLKAFAPLAREAELHLVGPVEPAMQDLFATLPMDNVAVRGAVSADQLPSVYADGDIFCLPSLEEGFPLVLLQAMASGLAVVTTPESGAEDILTDGREGYIVPSGDVELQTSALAKLCTDAELRRQMGAAARLRVEHGWCWDDYVDRALALYERVLS